MVQLDFLADHGLGFDDLARPGFLGDADDDGAGLGGVACPMHVSAAPLDLIGKLGEVRVQVLDHFTFQLAAALAQPLKTRNFLDGSEAVLVEAQRGGAQGFLNVRVADRLRSALVDFAALDARFTHRVTK